MFRQPTNQQPNAMCQRWFSDALNHCSESLIFHAEPSSWSDKLSCILPSFLRPTVDPSESEDAALYSSIDESPLEPFLMNKLECQNLIYRVTKDYLRLSEHIKMETYFYQTVIICVIIVILTTFMVIFVPKPKLFRSKSKMSTKHLCEVCNFFSSIKSTSSDKETQMEELIDFIQRKKVFEDLTNFMSNHSERSLAGLCNKQTNNTPSMSARSDDLYSHSNSTFRVYPPSRIPVAQNPEQPQQNRKSKMLLETIDKSQESSDYSLNGYTSAQDIEE